MKKIFNEYQEYLLFYKKLSKSTTNSYIRDLKQYQKYLSQVGVSDYKNVNINILNNFINSQKLNRKSSSTIIRNIVTLKSFYKYLCSIDLMSNNPTNELKPPKKDIKYPVILSNNDIDKLISPPIYKGIKGKRDKMMVMILCSIGLRVSELININIEDVNFKDNYLICKNSKEERIIRISNEISFYLKDYITNVRPKLESKKSTNKAFFLNLNGTRLSRQGFWKIIKSYKEKANIKTDLTPHTLRHTVAINMMKNGIDIKHIKSILGHSDISSLQMYKKFLKEIPLK